MRVSNIERVNEPKIVEGNLRKGSKFIGEIKEVNLEKGEVTISLKNGKELSAKIEGDISKLAKGTYYKFESLGVENGELKLVIENNIKDVNSKKNILEMFMKENKIPLKDKELLESMIKNNIPLTKENINKVKSFIELNTKISSNKEINLDNFKKYIDETLKILNTTNNIKLDSGEYINRFFKNFAELDRNNILTFIENNIDFNGRNIESFNKIFKGDFEILKILENIEYKALQNEVKEELVTENKEINKDFSYRNGNGISKENQLKNEFRSLEVLDGVSKEELKLSKMLDSIGSETLKVEIKKELLNTIESLYNYTENEENVIEFENDVASLNDKSLKILDDKGKNEITARKELTEEIELNNKNFKVLSKLLKEDSMIFKSINNFNDETLKGEVKNKIHNEIREFDEKLNNEIQIKDEKNSPIIKQNQGGALVENISKIIRELSSLDNYKSEGMVFKSDMSKILNGLLKDFTVRDELIKFNNLKEDIMLREGVEVESKSVSEMLDYKVLEEKGGDLEGNHLRLENIEKKINEFNNIKSSFSNKLTEVLGQNIFSSDEEVELLLEAVSEEFKILESGNKKGLESLIKDSERISKEIKLKENMMQNIIKNIMKDLSGSKANVIMDIIKNNINDFKLFNELSNEYYYMDLPININKEEYGCKLIIKDERGEGKAIDKNNLKLVLSVKTVNVGTVDALLKISNKNLNIELKVEGKETEKFKKNLSILEKSLELLGFMPYIFVSEKLCKFTDISSYREFFNENSESIVDKLV